MYVEIGNAKYLEDAQGRLVPLKLVNKVDLERDKLVRKLVEEGAKISAELTDYKRRALEACAAFVERSAKEYETTLGGEKGNITLSSYDASVRLTLATHERLHFDERLQVAKKLVDECIKKWAKGTRAEVRALITDAFKVDRKGRLDTGRLLSLRSLDIKDDQWRQAMAALSDAVTVSRSQQYLRLQRRRDDGGYDPIPLSLASV